MDTQPLLIISTHTCTYKEFGCDVIHFACDCCAMSPSLCEQSSVSNHTSRQSVQIAPQNVTPDSPYQSSTPCSGCQWSGAGCYPTCKGSCEGRLCHCHGRYVLVRSITHAPMYPMCGGIILLENTHICCMILCGNILCLIFYSYKCNNLSTHLLTVIVVCAHIVTRFS